MTLPERAMSCTSPSTEWNEKTSSSGTEIAPAETANLS